MNLIQLLVRGRNGKNEDYPPQKSSRDSCGNDDSRIAIKYTEVVYLLTANKAEKYMNGRSYIVYVGRTAHGKSRVASSMAFRASKVLSGHGVTELEDHLLHGSFVEGQGMERKLEAAVLAAFKMFYGEIPRQNRQGKGSKLKWTNEMDRLFGLKRLKAIFDDHDKYALGHEENVVA